MDKVEVVHAFEDGGMFHIFLDWQKGMLLIDALNASGIFTEWPELKENTFGVFGSLAQDDTLLQPGDRVEIYRALRCDPKEQRRQRVKVQKK